MSNGNRAFQHMEGGRADRWAYRCLRGVLLAGIWLLSHAVLMGQGGVFTGKVTVEKESLAGVSVSLSLLNRGSVSNSEGQFKIENIPDGRYEVKISFMGFVTQWDTINVRGGQTIRKDYVMMEDIFKLRETVVTGTRNKIERYRSPVIVNTISRKTFEATQSISLAEGLSFSPGLRLENNCQNCGFTQVRMNGLDGAYSQILINSRPVFSALAGVYGLEMLPANMVEKIEVVRGGGSVLYGGNAIAGTINVITRDPITPSFEVGINQSYIQMEVPDRTLTVNGAVVSDDLDKGVTFFGFNRIKEPWDANGDGFSELVQLKNNTFGFDAFYHAGERRKLRFGSYHIHEFRRGGNGFDRYPHQTDLTEQLQHDIHSAHASYEYFTPDLKQKWSGYASMQRVKRQSYYGGGGRILDDGDTLTQQDILAINAYGESSDLSAVVGTQYYYEIHPRLMMTTGLEYIYNDVLDEMPGYGRRIEQQVGMLGIYAQLEYKWMERLTLLIGGRWDMVRIWGDYLLAGDFYRNNRQLQVRVPRISAMYQPAPSVKIRASFAQGYRAPQAFDEDIHIETVGGSARFVSLDTALKTERSNSALLSLNYDKVIGKKQVNMVIEGFYTRLLHPFIMSDQVELPNGVAVITKRNGDAATVTGVNLEANMAWGRKWVLQSGATIQRAFYDVEEVIWQPEEEDDPTPVASTKVLLRTPDVYGYFSLVYSPVKSLSISSSGTYTGAMRLSHVIDPETEQTVIKSSPVFVDKNLKISYNFSKSKTYKAEVFAGVQNMFNQFQKDFDVGAVRDAGYVYGPMRPRTIFFGLKFGL